MLKKLLLLTLFSYNTSLTWSSPLSQKQIELATASFTTGCISSVMAVIDAGYSFNKGLDTPRQFIDKLKKQCTKQAGFYKKDLKRMGR